jgi:hypothetical protein
MKDFRNNAVRTFAHRPLSALRRDLTTASKRRQFLEQLVGHGHTMHFTVAPRLVPAV